MGASLKLARPPLDLDPWDQQEGELTKLFHAFTHFRDLRPDVRSIDKAWHDHRERCLQHPAIKRRAEACWFRYSANWGWIQRAQAWDRYQDQMALERIARGQAEARARHAKLANGMLQALVIPAKAALEALQDGTSFQDIVANAKANPEQMLKLIEMAANAARSLQSVVQVERLAIGLTTESIDIEDRRGDTSFARRVAADPATQELAFALLDRIARSGSGDGAPERLRLLSQPGDVEASSAPDLADQKAVGSE